MIVTPIYRSPNPSFVPPPHVKTSNVELKDTIMQICKYCLYIASKYKFDMEPEFDNAYGDVLNRILVFKFKAPSGDGAEIHKYMVAILKDRPADDALRSIREVAGDAHFKKYINAGATDTGDQVANAMLKILEHFMI